MSTVLADAVQAWQLVKIDGFIIFDDYKKPNWPSPMDMRPDWAIDAFLTANRREIKLLENKNQVIAQRLTPVINKNHVSRFGSYAYDWSNSALLSAEGTVALTSFESDLLKRLLGSLKFGDVELDITEPIWSTPEAEQLFAKLKITPESFLYSELRNI
jgi:hypothetical protein